MINELNIDIIILGTYEECEQHPDTSSSDSRVANKSQAATEADKYDGKSKLQ